MCVPTKVATQIALLESVNEEKEVITSSLFSVTTPVVPLSTALGPHLLH